MNNINPVFVFGSNLAGQHNGGVARHAVLHYGAQMGQAEGLQGNSYAIPTVAEIEPYVREFVVYAARHQHAPFLVTAIGCGIAGHSPRDIAPLFHGASENVFLSEKLVAALR